MFVIIALVDLELLGLIYWWGLTINIMTITWLMVSIRIAVDYTAHITHYWLRVKIELRDAI